MLRCGKCGTERWHWHVKGLLFVCKECGTQVDLAVAKRQAAVERKRKRAEKAKADGRAPRPKRARRELDAAYMAWIHGWPCCVPGCSRWPVEAHHLVPRSRGGSDRTCLPLCDPHHDAFHDQLGSMEAADKEWGSDLERAVDTFNALYEGGAEPPNHYQPVVK